MNLREIVLVGSIFLSSLVFFQNKDKLNFDVTGKIEGGLLPKIKTSLNISPDEIDFSFLWGFYSMEFKKINDSTYQEIVKNNIPFTGTKHEFYEYGYSFKDSCYTFNDYSVIKGQPREEKEVLKGRVFDKKYKSLPDLFRDFIQGNIKDTMNVILLGNHYSASLKSMQKGIYIGNPNDFIKKEEGDVLHFDSPIKIHTKRENGKVIPLGFSTKCLYVRNGKTISIEGILKKE